MPKAVDAVRSINREIDQAVRQIEQVSRLVKELEGTLQLLEKQKDQVKKDTMTKVELSSTIRKVEGLKSAVNRLESELSDTNMKISKITW